MKVLKVLAWLAMLVLAVLVVTGVLSGVLFAWIFLIESLVVFVYYLGVMANGIRNS